MKRFILVCTGLALALGAHGSGLEAAQVCGKQFEELVLHTLEGQRTALQEVIRGKPAVINFTTTWCLDCKKLEKVFGSIISRYSKQGVVFCFVYVGQKKDQVAEALKGHPQDGIVRLLDEKRKEARKIKLSGIPQVIITDAAGRMRYSGLPLEDNALSAEIDKVL